MRYVEYLLLALSGAVAVYAASPQTRDLVPVQLGDITKLAHTSDAAPAQDREDQDREDMELLLKECDRETQRADEREAERLARCAELGDH